jgi:hypothetical protein
VTMTVTAAEVVRAGLVSVDPVVLPRGPAWETLWADLRDEKLVPALAQAMHCGAVRGSRDQHDIARRAHEVVMRSCVRLERVALDELRRLDRAGIDARLLKGAAVAHLDYPDPAWRGFGDVDLLVRPSHYDAAVDVLASAGSRRRSDEPRAGFDRRFGKGVCMIRPDGVQVDVHRSFAAGPFGVTVDTDELFAMSSTFSLGGSAVRALDSEGRFLHACYHAALGDFPARLASLRDVAQMLLGGAIDIDRARATAGRWRAGVVLASAVATAWSVFRLPRTTSVDWAFTYVPDRFERVALGAYVGPRRSYARQMAAAVPAVRGWRNRAAYVFALVIANGDYVERRDGGYARRIGRAVRMGAAR